MSDGVRHVWVRPGHGPTEMPGLVLDWRRDEPGAWSARVVYVDPRGKVVMEWLPSDNLRPVQPQTG